MKAHWYYTNLHGGKGHKKDEKASVQDWCYGRAGRLIRAMDELGPSVAP